MDALLTLAEKGIGELVRMQLESLTDQ